MHVVCTLALEDCYYDREAFKIIVVQPRREIDRGIVGIVGGGGEARCPHNQRQQVATAMATAPKKHRQDRQLGGMVMQYRQEFRVHPCTLLTTSELFT